EDALQSLQLTLADFTKRIEEEKKAATAPRPIEPVPVEKPVVAKTVPEVTTPTPPEPQPLPVQRAPVLPEDGRYAWYRQHSLHAPLTASQPFRFAVGDDTQFADLELRLHSGKNPPLRHRLADGSDFHLGTGLQIPTLHAELKDGYLELSLLDETIPIPSNDNLSVIDLRQKREYPLFFQRGTSAIKGTDNLTAQLQFDLASYMVVLRMGLNSVQLPDKKFPPVYLRLNNFSFPSLVSKNEHIWKVSLKALGVQDYLDKRTKNLLNYDRLDQLLLKKRERILNDLPSLTKKSDALSNNQVPAVIKSFKTYAKDYNELIQTTPAQRRQRMNSIARKMKVNDQITKLDDAEFLPRIREVLKDPTLQNRFVKERAELTKEYQAYVNYADELKRLTDALQDILIQKMPVSLIDQLLGATLAEQHSLINPNATLAQNIHTAQNLRTDLAEKDKAQLPAIYQQFQAAFLEFRTSSQPYPVLPLQKISFRTVQ
ncbi:MAG: hypothetical protein IJJ26_07975, partial [Victivallales bacterium]|nr:hypothetical protein [Victivallales bacterium]